MHRRSLYLLKDTRSVATGAVEYGEVAGLESRYAVADGKSVGIRDASQYGYAKRAAIDELG
jgi:hypothetical protein